MPQWFATAPPPPPMSKEFETHDCIWYYGTLYVKEAVAVAKINEKQQLQSAAVAEQVTEQVTEQTVAELVAESNFHGNDNNDNGGDEDDETESVCSGTSKNEMNLNNAAFKHPRNIGKQNQLKYLKDGMLLRHMVQLNNDEWVATFDAETNRIIRTPDGVAFDTLRQFARLHCNEVEPLGSSHSTNVWTDTHFQYHNMDYDSWHPLANLKH